MRDLVKKVTLQHVYLMSDVEFDSSDVMIIRNFMADITKGLPIKLDEILRQMNLADSMLAPMAIRALEHLFHIYDGMDYTLLSLATGVSAQSLKAMYEKDTLLGREEFVKIFYFYLQLMFDDNGLKRSQFIHLGFTNTESSLVTSWREIIDKFAHGKRI